MKETLISNELLQLCNKHGFNTNKIADMYVVTNISNKLYTDGPKWKNEIPTLSLIQKWLREHKNYHISITYKDSNSNKIEGINSVYFDIQIFQLLNGDVYKIHKFQEYSDNYDECLIYAIEYIYIKKYNKMKEQLITYETAKLAKDKGFDWGVLNYYSIINKNLCQIGAKRWFPTQNCNKISTQLSTPTQSLLQKWIREQHNTIITVFPFTITNFITDDIDDNDKFIFSYVIHQNSFFILDNTNFKTYENALEHALQEALKLL